MPPALATCISSVFGAGSDAAHNHTSEVVTKLNNAIQEASMDDYTGSYADLPESWTEANPCLTTGGFIVLVFGSLAVCCCCCFCCCYARQADKNGRGLSYYRRTFAGVMEVDNPVVTASGETFLERLASAKDRFAAHLLILLVTTLILVLLWALLRALDFRQMALDFTDYYIMPSVLNNSLQDLVEERRGDILWLRDCDDNCWPRHSRVYGFGEQAQHQEQKNSFYDWASNGNFSDWATNTSLAG